MPEEKHGPIDRLLAEVQSGQVQAAEQLTKAACQELRRMAEQHLRQRFGRAEAGLTWQPTALVNETILRIFRQRRQFDNEGHFFAIATTIMKRVLLDYIRQRRARKRGGEGIRVQFDPEVHSPLAPDTDGEVDLEALFGVVDRLASLDARKADVARMRLIWGMKIEEIAESLGVSRATVERDWSFSRAWIRRELGGSG